MESSLIDTRALVDKTPEVARNLIANTERILSSSEPIKFTTTYKKREKVEYFCHKIATCQSHLIGAIASSGKPATC